MIAEKECLLCRGPADIFENISQKAYYSCRRCGAVFLDPSFHLSLEQEKARYETHNNDVHDPGYQRFVRPIVDEVNRKFGLKHQGLDFGAGTGPVITKLLQDQGYGVKIYDPFFANNPEVLEETYDFIVCCEVMEHFRYPARDFHLLRSLLNPQGILFCMTELYSAQIDFQSWYYKNDPTHIFFYQRKTCEWIRDEYGFSDLSFHGRMIEFFA